MSENKSFIITDDAGSIGSVIFKQYIVNRQDTIINMDILTNAGNLEFHTSVNRSAISSVSKFNL